MKKRNNRPYQKTQRSNDRDIPSSFAIKDISGKMIGKTALLEGMIDRISQTGGPTIFAISDGTGSFLLKGFDKPGERAFPEIEEGDCIKTRVKISEFNNTLEGEISKIQKMDSNEKDSFIKGLEAIEIERAKPKEISFLISSPILDKLKPRFIKAATEIRLAIIKNRPIIVRHHNDADGYSSGFALERAILPLIEKQHSSTKAAWEFFARAPCAAPFYEIDDSIRDTATSLRNVAKFSNKMPLVIIADNGSSSEDLLGIKQGKVHGMDFIVVDHHYFDKDVISQEVLVHINPFLVEEDGTKFSAGMLCTELARLINQTGNIEPIPALAGFADRVDNKNAMEQYLKIAEQKGYSKKLLMDIATVIDFVSAKLRFMEAREYIEVLFGEPREKQKNLVNLMAPYIRQLEEKGLAMASDQAKLEKIGNVTLQTLDIESTFPGFGFYPKPGRAVGLVHDSLQEKKKLTSVITIGIMSSAITIRATEEANFSVHELISYLRKKLPNAFIEGGGHKNAGSITFVPSQQKEVLKYLKEFIKS